MLNAKLPEEDLKKIETFGLYLKVYISVHVHILELYIKLFINATIV